MERNLIPTISSFLKVKFWERLGKTKIWWEGPYSYKEKQWVKKNTDKPELITALQLRKILQVKEQEIIKFKPRLIKIQYEDLVKNCENEIKSILQFCKLSEEKEIFDYIKQNPIIDMNKPDEEYFNPQTLKEIYGVLNSGVV